MALESKDRVVIVGAGPVGLACALWLAKSQIPVVVLEKGTDLPQELRASTFHHPTLELLEEIGITPTLISQGVVTPTWQYRIHETGERAEFDLAVLAGITKYPYRLQCEQFKLTRIMCDRLRESGQADIRFDAEVTDVAQDDTGATVTFRQAGEVHRLQARYVIGADGARSVVRKCLNLAFEGKTYPDASIVVVTTFEFRDHIPYLSGVNYCWGQGAEYFGLLRVQGRWRCGFHPRPGETIEEAVSELAIESQLQAVFSRPVPYEVTAKAPYRSHKRIVDRFRVGRVILAGDAAHLNSGQGGMGMNSGIHDAASLCEKLVRVWHGESDGLLDLYSRQRRAVATDYVQAQSDKNFSRVREKDPALRRDILAEYRRISQDPEQATRFLLRSSMADSLRYAATIT